MNNIFVGNGLKVKFVHIIYKELMKREFVSLCDILKIYYERDEEYYKKVSFSKETGYGELSNV